MKRPTHDAAFAARWGRSKDWCAACGAGEYGTHTLTNHHLIGGKGGRSDEACNLLRLGWHPCHQLAEGLDIVDPRNKFNVLDMDAGVRRLLPKITLPIALSLKLRADPDEYDADRLAELLGRPLPVLQEVPAFFVRLWDMNMKEKTS